MAIKSIITIPKEVVHVTSSKLKYKLLSTLNAIITFLEYGIPLTLVACYLYRLQRTGPSNKEANLILEELPAVTEPFFLKVGPSFFSFTGSNCAYGTPKESCQL